MFSGAFCAIILCSLLWDLLPLLTGKQNFIYTLDKTRKPWPGWCSHRAGLLRTEVVDLCFEMKNNSDHIVKTRESTVQQNWKQSDCGRILLFVLFSAAHFS